MNRGVFSVVPAGVTAAGMPPAAGVTAAAGVPFFMVMVIAMEILTHFQCSVQKGLNHLPDISGGSADQFDPRRRQSIDGSGADPAADQQIHFGSGKQGGEGTMTRIPCGKAAFRKNGSAVGFKNGKFPGMSEMGKNLIIFARYCNFHKTFYSLLIWVGMMRQYRWQNTFIKFLKKSEFENLCRKMYIDKIIF